MTDGHEIFDAQTREVMRLVNENHERLKNEEILNNLIDNSVPKEGKGKRRVIVNWKNVTMLASIIFALVMVLVNLYSSLSAKLAENQAFKKVLEESEITKIVAEAERTYRNPGQAEYVTDHDTYAIGEHLVLESEDFHQDLYITAHEISKEYDDATEEKVMDSVLKQVSNINDEANPNYVLDYNSWEDYCIRHGFVDKDGKADFEKYMKEMKSHIASEKQDDNFENEHGLRSFR